MSPTTELERDLGVARDLAGGKVFRSLFRRTELQHQLYSPEHSQASRDQPLLASCSTSSETSAVSSEAGRRLNGTHGAWGLFPAFRKADNCAVTAMIDLSKTGSLLYCEYSASQYYNPWSSETTKRDSGASQTSSEEAREVSRLAGRRTNARRGQSRDV